jgi:phosphoglycolate phosphatase
MQKRRGRVRDRSPGPMRQDESTALPTASALLFDLDGVLVDSRTAITACMNHALAEHGLPSLSPDLLRRFIGPPLATAFVEMTGAAADSALVASCVGAYRRRYAVASLRDTTVIPGVTEVVASLARHFRLAVATSKPTAFAEPLVEALGLRHLFAAVVGPDMKVQGEDKGRTIAKALAVLGGPGRAVMIGDRSFDILGARANSLPSIGVTWGIGDREELEAAGADAVIDKPTELPAAATRLI